MKDTKHTISTDTLPEHKSRQKPDKPVKKNTAPKKYRATCNQINAQARIVIHKDNVLTEAEYNKLPESMRDRFEEFTVHVKLIEG